MTSQETKDFRWGSKQIPIKANLDVQNLWLSDAGIEVNQNMFNDGGRRMPWSKIASFDVDGADSIQSRVTATRIVALGVFALAAKKKTGSSFLTITLHSGEALLFEVPKISAPELRARIQPFRTKLTSAQPSSQQPSNSVTDELIKLSGLLEKGILTEAEFEQQKHRILGS